MMNRTTRISTATFGAIVGLAGFEHGLGEVLQGNIVPGPNPILSWPNSPAFKIMGGEPAMTILPNMLVTGILAMIVSLAVAAWSVYFLQKKGGWAVLAGLCVLLLLFGGGYAPPVLGWITAAAAIGINSSFNMWRRILPEGVQRFLARLWGWCYGFALGAWLSLIPGLIIISFFNENMDHSITVILAGLAFLGLFLTVFTAMARDIVERKAM